MFNEKETEYSAKRGGEIPVLQSPKYIEAKNKAIELIKSEKYGLTEADFWILMNETKTGKMIYSGLIISHNGCLKINDKIENKVNPRCFELDKEGYANSLTYTYMDDEIYEVGEVSKDNCKNQYPYAMAYKRCFDRVVLKKCKLAYAGVYSDSEADEFSGKDREQEMPKIDKTMEEALRNLIKNHNILNEKVIEILNKYSYKRLADIEISNLTNIANELEKISNKEEK